MIRILRPACALFVLACFVFVSSALSAQAAKHTTHHAHHKASTHTSTICSWMCAAGQVLQSVDFELREPSLTSLADDVNIPHSLELIFSQPSKSRAPPSQLFPTK